MTKIALNGFGRIGRCLARIITRRKDFELVAINSNADASSHAYLLKYDSVHRTLSNDVKAVDDALYVDGRKVQVFSYKKPEDIPWNTTEADVVIDTTGKFKTKEELKPHLKGNVKQIVISCPPKDNIKTIVFGVNEEEITPKSDNILSTASCTTLCLATVAKVLHDEFGIVAGVMTTVHAITTSQQLLDKSNKKVRRRRSAFLNMVFTTTGASEALAKVIPDLEGKIECLSLRVPIPDVSLIDFNVNLEKAATAEEINKAFEKYANGELKGLLGVAEEELVSTDYYGDQRSAIIDPFLTRVLPGNISKVIAWYDNEWGYSERILDLLAYINKR